MTENLNLHYNTQRLVLLALNKYKRKNKAAKMLGISIRTLHRLCWSWGVVKVDDQFFIPETKKQVA